MEQADADRNRAVTICEHALSLISQSNDRTDLGGGSWMGHWSNRRFGATLLIPAASIEAAYVAHVLEVWDEDDKVLSACWDDPEQIEIRLLKPGEWQAEFLAA